MRTQAKPVSSFPSARATCVFTLLITPLALLFCSNVAYAQRTGASAQTVTEDSLKTTYGTKNSLPYVTTDLQEYPPGATVTIYGSGFHSGEIVSLRVDYPQPTGAGFGRSFALSAEADPTGWFQATWILPFDTQVDDTLSLTGEGTFSGRQATTSFSSRNTSLELNILGAVSFCPSDSGAAPDTLIAQAILSQACEPYKDGDLDGREILFFLRSGECEGDHTNLRVDTALTDEQGIAFAAIPIPSGAGNFSIKAKFRGESRPEECREPGNSSCYSGPYRHERCARLSKAKDCREFSVRSDGCSQPALLNCPADTLIDMCAAGEICLWPLRVQDGSGSRVASPDVSLSFGTLRGDSICFVADTPGVYTITAVLADGSGLIDSCQVTATVTFNNLPEIIHNGRTFEACFAGAVISHDLNAVDFENDPLSWSLGPGIGSIDQNGMINFVADTAGSYCFTARVSDLCGTVEASVCVTVLLNDLPQLNEFSDTIRACAGDSVCFTVTGSDRNSGDILEIAQLGGPGSFSMNTDTSGVACFRVGGLSSPMTYTFDYRITDNCLRDSSGAATPRAPTGGVNITVIPSEPLSVSLPDHFSVSRCTAEQLCVPVTITGPDANLVAVNTNFGVFNEAQMRVCYLPDGPGVDTLIVSTVDVCGGVSVDSVVITVESASSQIVTCPNDTSLFICDSGKVCVPFGIFPGDVTVTISPSSATYDSQSGNICFNTAYSVRKELSAIVSGPCGVDTCRFVVDVTRNSKPLVIAEPAVNAALCGAGEVCWAVGISDADFDISSITMFPAGSYDAVTGQACFPADTSGAYQVIISAVDSCGAVGVDTTVLNVRTNAAPQISTGPDMTLQLCDPREICIGAIPSDPDGAPPTVTTNVGSYNSIFGTICFLPDSAGVYTVIGTATDSCGASDADTTVVTVIFNGPPLTTLGADTTINQCQLAEICLPVEIPGVVGNDNLLTIVTNAGVYNPVTRNVCFTPAGPGVKEIIITATDGCGAQFSDTILVNALVDQSAGISCPTGPVSVNVCGQDSVFYPLEIAPLNALVAVQGGIFSAGMLRFRADTSGFYSIHVEATSDCGSSICDVVFDVNVGGQITLNCPTDTSVFLCGPLDTVFVPVGLMVDSASVVVSGGGFFRDGKVGFVPINGAGTYTTTVTVDNACGTSTCSFVTHVSINAPPSIQVNDTALSLCAAHELSLPLTVSDPDNNVVSISSDRGTVVGGTVRFTPPGPGEFQIIVTATDSCGLSVSDTGLVSIALNSAPDVDLGADTSISLCAAENVCLPVTVVDTDNNIQSVTVSGAVYTGGGVCFTPVASGARTIILTAVDSCGASASDTLVVALSLNSPPLVSLTGLPDTALCAPVEICLEGSVSDDNVKLVEATGGVFANGGICFTPDTSGSYTFILTATDSCDFVVADTASVVVTLNLAPVVNASPDTTVSICNGGAICVPVSATDPNGNMLTVTATGARNAVFSNGLVCFDPDSSGVYTIIVTATDTCLVIAVDTVVVTVSQNSAPTAAFATDSLIIQCATDSACAPVTVFDADDNLASVTVSGGVYDEQSGEVCFLPLIGGSAVITLTAVDSCGLSAVDSLIVEVNPGQSFTLDCPLGDSVFICEPDTLCVPFPGVPPGADVIVSPASAWYDAALGSVCFYTNCSVVKKLSVVVISGCFADSCAFTLNVTMNSAPLVIAAPDTAAILCGPGDVCLPAGVSDADYNLDLVRVEPLGFYNAVSGQVCVPIDTSGLYLVVVNAFDSCSARASDSVYINATVNRSPLVDIVADTSVFICGPVDICLPVVVGDPEDNIFFVAPSMGIYDELDRTVCFTPDDTGGVYRVTVTAVDSCGFATAATALVNVVRNAPPMVELAAETSVSLCTASEVCVPVTISDSNGNLFAVTTSPGSTYNPITGEVCFIAAASGTIPITVSATDSCGAFTSRTIDVNVTINSPPQVVAATDTTTGGCSLSEVCFPVGVSDIDYNIASVSVTPLGMYDPISGLVCLTPLDTGTLAVVVTAIDSCGQIGSDTITVVSTLGSDVSIDCPPAPLNVFFCGPDTVRQMISVDPVDASITASFGSYINGQLAFFADTAGVYQIDLIAVGSCGADTCRITFVVTQDQVPQFTCPADTGVFLCAPDEICRPVGVLPSGATVTISPAGRYEAGMICVIADTSGIYLIEAVAQTACGTDTCSFTVDVTINQGPVVTAPSDTSVFVCNLGVTSICRPVSVSDFDGNLLRITVPPFATYDTTGQICFTPDTVGTYLLYVDAVDSCGARSTKTFTVQVSSTEPAAIACPDTAQFEFCADLSQSFPLTISPAGALVTASAGALIGTDSLSFFFDTSGVYTSTIIAVTACGADTCELVVNATRIPPPTVSCPADQVAFFCSPDTLCLPLVFSPVQAALSASSPAYISGDSVCIPLLTDTTLTITLTAAVSCAQASCSFTITAEVNEAPVVSLGTDFDVLQCASDSICVPVTLADDESNIASVTTSLGVFDPQRNVVCFLPPTVGTFCMTVTAEDSCGARGADTLCMTVRGGGSAAIACPQGLQQASLCSPDTVCLLAPVSGSIDSVVTSIGLYDPASKEVCFLADTSGIYSVMMIAFADCGNDTCRFDVNVKITPVPTLTCPDPLDTVLCVSQTDSLCVTIGAVSPGSLVEVRPVGSYNAGDVCVPVDTPGVYVIDVIASTSCGQDSCQFTFTVNDNDAPALFTPVSERAPYCVGDTDKICISGIYATDTEGDPLTIAQICGPGALTLTGGDSAVICFTPTSVDSVYEFCVQVSDGCHSQTKTFFVTVFPSPSCGSSARVAIVGPGSTFTFPDTLAPGPAAAPECVLVGGEAAVEIIAETFDRVGGYDMLISYDASAVAFLFADPGAGIGDWEFFTFNSGPSSSCGVACPNGLLRLVAIADANDGASHPPNSAFSPQGVIARVSFLVSQNQLLGSQFVPVRFFWVDCGDNSFSDPDGEVLYLDSRVFSADGSLIWNEDDDTKFPSASRPPGLGADDACLVGGSGTRPVRGVDYFQGGICIVHPDSINDRGDLNLNGISYEIADAVTYTNYFIIGLRAFKINLAAQVAASDVNADGATLTIADLVFLIRVLTGDENPIPKIVPSGAGATVYLERDTAGYSITSEAQMNIGAAVFTFEFDGPPPESVTLAGGLAGMDLRYSIEDGRIRALVYERAESAYGAFIPAGKTQLMSISLPDDYVGEVRLINAELSDQQGWAVVTPRIETNILPKSFELAQNYPNPFNPSTRIKLSLPQASRWSLTVYNVLGRQVRRYVGQDDAGVVDIVWDGRDESGSHVASGIYLYQAKAGSFRSTRKMLLLK